MSLDIRQSDCIFLVVNRLLHIEHIKDAVGARHGLLHHAVKAADALDGIRQVDGIRQEGDERARRHFPVDDFIAANPEDERDRNRREKFHRRRQQARYLHILHFSAKIQLVLVMEPSNLMLLAHKGLDDADRRDALLQERIDIGKTLLYDRARLLELLAEDVHRLSHERHSDQRDQREFPIEIEHQDDGTDENRSFRHKFDELVDQGALQSLHIIRRIAHDLARLHFIEIGQWHALELPEKRLAQINDNALPDIRNKIALPIIEDAAEEKDDDDAAGDEVQHAELALRQHLVDHILDDPRHIEVRRRRHDDAEDGHDETLQIGLDIFQQTNIVLHASLPFLCPPAAASTCAATRTAAPGGPSCSTETLRRAMTDARCASPR